MFLCSGFVMWRKGSDGRNSIAEQEIRAIILVVSVSSADAKTKLPDFLAVVCANAPFSYSKTMGCIFCGPFAVFENISPHITNSWILWSMLCLSKKIM